MTDKTTVTKFVEFGVVENLKVDMDMVFRDYLKTHCYPPLSDTDIEEITARLEMCPRCGMLIPRGSECQTVHLFPFWDTEVDTGGE